MVDDGASVKKGEVICELDASEYEEMTRRQRIVVEEATAAHSQASLALEVARLSFGPTPRATRRRWCAITRERSR